MRSSTISRAAEGVAPLAADREPERPRRAEILAALSLAIDLGLGQPMEHMLRSSLLATSLAGRLGLDERRQGVVFYANLMTWIGCHADSHELAYWFGDDIAFRADSYDVDWTGLPFARLLATHVGRDRSAPARVALAASLFAHPRSHLRELISSHCVSAGVLAERAGLGAEVADVLTYAFERFDGGGLPRGTSGADIPIETRVVQVAEVVEVHLRRSGLDGAVAVLRARSGTQFDPAVVSVFEAAISELTAELPVDEVWPAALQRAPDRDHVVSEAELDELLEAIGDFVDLKCPYMVGHSRGVATLAAGAAECYGLPAVQVRLVRRAGLVHDLGRMGVPNSVWEKRGRLSEAEWERVRLYPYLTGRILSRIRGFGDIAAVASAHHERLDGSGYPRGLAAVALTPAQRLLAAADTYYTLREDRPYRAAYSAVEAADLVREEVRRTRLDAPAVDAVLEAAGQPVRRRRTWPAGLTSREVDVLRLVARGASNSAIAAALQISEKTVRNHVEHIYTKIDVKNRTGASLYALNHGIITAGYRDALPET
jgi:HD-GYP domain-containing protein (c-di-GMP phosphodiesterase class II)